MKLVSHEQARRIAVQAQLLDGSATGVLDTVRRLGFLQIDPIATVATPQHLVLWSRLGAWDTAELDRLLWETKELFERDAFIRPIEDLPLVRGFQRRWRQSTRYKSERWVRGFLTENRAFRRYVLHEIEQRGPLLSRTLDDRAKGEPRDHRWWGSRRVGLMLESLHVYGEIAVAGRREGQRLWDLSERWYPETSTLSVKAAESLHAEQRFRALGVRQVSASWEAHPEAADCPIPDRTTFLSPFDRLIHDRDRAEALFGFHYRLEMYVPKAKREHGYYVLPILRDDQLIGRIEPVFDRKSRVLNVNGIWAQPGAPADAGADIGVALGELASWLGTSKITVGSPVPRAWAKALRATV